MKTNFALPQKPSKLLAVALEDLEKMEKTEGYAIHMNDWHWPEPLWKDGDQIGTVCKVCFAGSVMARRGKVLPTRDVQPESFSPKLRKKFYALNAFREGCIEEGLNYLGIDDVPPCLRENYGATQYRDDPARFKKEMRQLIAVFAALGL